MRIRSWQEISAAFPNPRFGLVTMVCAGWMVLAVAGCGRSDPSESTIVPPPSPAVSSQDESGPKAATATDTTDQAPGAIELPPGDIPPPSNRAAPAEQGFELPTGADVPDAAGASAAAGANAAARIQYCTWEEIQGAVKSSGRVTVVDLWSLSCEPCTREFPGLVQTHRQLGAEVQCIAVDVDFDGRRTRPPEYYEPRVVEFLSGVGATDFPTYISRTPSEDIFVSMDIASLPAVMIYDARGEVVKVFTDSGQTVGFTYAQDVVPVVQKLIGG